jgi:hypothetical protein
MEEYKVLQYAVTDSMVDWHSQSIAYRKQVDGLLDRIMDVAQMCDQHHVKLDFEIDASKEPIYSHTNLLTGEIIHKYSQGVSPVLKPHHTISGRSGVYALCHDRSKTIYVGANKYIDSAGSIYDRLSRFGRGIYDRLSPEENHSAGTKYRGLYGENTSNLYVSFVFYKQLGSSIFNLMDELNIKLKDLEMLYIRKFSSQYLLNVIRK